MEGIVFALHAAAYRNIVEFHLSTLNGLHVIPAIERPRQRLSIDYSRSLGMAVDRGRRRKGKVGAKDWKGLKPSPGEKSLIE